MKRFEIQYIDDEVENSSILKIYLIKNAYKICLEVLYNIESINLYREWMLIHLEYGIIQRDKSIEKFLNFRLSQKIKDYFFKKYPKTKLKEKARD